MWHLAGKTNDIYLLGSIHLLRDSDYPIPDAIYAAYEAADTLIMELDMDDMDPIGMQALIREIGMLPDGRTLQDALGETVWRQASALADELEIPLAMMATTKPWLAAMTVEVMIMSRLGFQADQGVEMHLMARAVKDGKEVLGLETQRQQLEMLDGLSGDAQRELLLQTLQDGSELADTLDQLINAWREGDVEFLQAALLDDMRSYRELYEEILVERNRSWVDQILQLVDDEEDYLIIVGALHLIGPDGVPALLRRRGMPVEQVVETE